MGAKRSKAEVSAAATRFDRIKANWKGAVQTVLEEEVEEGEDQFSYGDFESFLDEQKYQFGRGDVVKGTVVQFEYQGALIDIGSKVIIISSKLFVI